MFAERTLMTFKTRKYPFILVVLVLVMLHGCAGIYSVVEFEILEPATVSLPGHVKHLIILNRAPLSLKSFEEEDTKGLDKKQLVMLDTLIVRNLSRGLLSILQQSTIEKFKYPLWASDRRLDTALLEDLILTRREVDAMCKEMGADAILSLESYSMDLDLEEEYFSGTSTEFRTKYYELSTNIRWVIYLPGSPRPFDTYTMVDTLFFPEVIDGIFQSYHSSASMIRDAFYLSGIKYGRYLVPVWVLTLRNLYKGKEDSLRLASKHTDQGEWDSAYVIWEKLSTGVDSTLVAKALHNMAIYHELEDNLDSANQLVTRAMEFDTLAMVREYKEELDMRILNRKELYIQVR